MADPLAFQFVAGSSLLHRTDPRIKTIALIALSLSTVGAYPLGLALLSAVLLALMVLSLRFPIQSAWRELRYFYLLLLVIFITRAIFTPGDALLDFGWLAVTYQGLLTGGLICWRLLLIVVAGWALTASTRPNEIRSAIERLLAPLPLVPAKKLAAMVGLIVRFIPVILVQAHETATAQKARGIENRKSPLVRLRHLALPLLRKTVQQADHLSVAMQARCFTLERTPPQMSIKRRDMAVLLLVVILCGVLIVSTSLKL